MFPKGKYKKQECNERQSFYDPPTTSSQDMIGLRTNSTSDDTCYPNSRFTFTKKLDDGSASVIFQGFDKVFNKAVIIKRISKKDEWRKELLILKEFSESNSERILKYIDYYESQRNSYIVTDFYFGDDLFEHIDINVPYNEKMGFTLFLEMIKGVKECHDKNIVHLDIKCENYMVKTPNLFENDGSIKQGSVILIDFGHAEKIKLEESIEKLRVGYNYGTSLYLCPEGLKKVFSSKSDIWSLGICLSMLLTGDFPFYGDEDEYYWNSLNSGIQLEKEISKEANLILKMCLDPDPIKRPSINQLISIVVRFLER